MTRQHSDGRPLGELLGDLASQTGTLIQKEVQLAKAEILEKAKNLGKHAGAVGAGGVIAHAGLLALTAALIIGLGNVMPLWLSALVVGLVAVVAGYALVRAGTNAIAREDLTPRETIETIREDKTWLKEQMR